MLVYGDQEDIVAVLPQLRRLRDRLVQAAQRPPSAGAASDLLDLFVDAGALAQGLVDADCHAAGEVDRTTPDTEALCAWMLALARLIEAEAASDAFVHRWALRAAMATTDLLLLRDWPTRVAVRHAEGFAHYGLYPDQFLAAGRRLAADAAGPPVVIGLRSIGLPLAALVAAASGAESFVTLRPVEDPFARHLSVDPVLVDRLAAPDETRIAIVDEGPGLSGSSFGATADLLEQHGVPRSRLVFCPGHAGDLGSAAQPAHRARWAEVQRIVIDFDTVFLGADRRLERLVGAALGAPARLVADLSAGRWRGARRFRRPPAVDAGKERRKFLFETPDGPVLAKFAGLGSPARAAVARQRRLAEAGFAPAVLGDVYGFVLDRFERDAAILDPQGPDRDRFLDRLGDYLGFRAAAFPADRTGASLETLAEMLRINVAEELGIRHDGMADLAARLSGEHGHPVHIDGRLRACEWLMLPDGRILKTDAVDHDRSHDLIGPQDIAWDIAGATVEFDLEAAERDRLITRIELAADRAVDRALLDFLIPCYAAFQLGAWRFAHDAAADERSAIETEIARYVRWLRRTIIPSGNIFQSGTSFETSALRLPSLP